MSAGSATMTPDQINAAQRAAVLSQSVEMTQALPAQTIAALTAANNLLTFVPRNVGLIKKFIIEITGTATNTDGVAASAATNFGLANLISNLVFFDYSNTQRINTSGLHLALLAQVKRHKLYPNASPLASTVDSMLAGEATQPVFPIITYTPPAKGAAQAFRAVFEVPLAYSDEDLRGSVFANLVNSQAQLAITLNPTAFGAAATDNTFNVFTKAGNLSNLTVTVYQVYLDQLPQAVVNGQPQPILPVLDLSTIYELKTTRITPLNAGQDNFIAYSNFRQFLSTVAVFNSTGADGGLLTGADVNYWALQSANLTNFFKIDPLLAAQFARSILGSDLPAGTYYFNHRRKPIITTQFGNMQLVLNPISAAAGSYLQVLWEAFANINNVTQAGSLA